VPILISLTAETADRAVRRAIPAARTESQAPRGRLTRPPRASAPSQAPAPQASAPPPTTTTTKVPYCRAFG